MALDPIKIEEALRAARSEREKLYQQARLTFSIRKAIHDLFDDPAYPQRRRSFGAIRNKLGIFEGKEQELRDMLFAMQARVHRGEGDDQLWHLPADAPRPVEPERPRPPYRLIILAVLAVLLLVLGLWKQIAGETPFETLSRLWPNPVEFETFAECIAAQPDSESIPNWRIKCQHMEFGRQ